MRNIINYKEHPYSKKNNILNINRALFNQQRSSVTKYQQEEETLSLNQLILDDVRNYLEDGKFSEIIKDSFGNPEKKSELSTIIYNYIATDTFNQKFKTEIGILSIDKLTELIVENIVGLSVIQPLGDNEDITDIKILAFNHVRADSISKGKYKTDIQFNSHEHYLELVNRFNFAAGKNYSISNPSINAPFPYMRINVVGKDLSPKVSTQIRKISKSLRYDENDMIKTGFMTIEAINLLSLCYPIMSIINFGAVASGKTENLRYFARYYKETQEIIVVEDTPETYLDELYPHLGINMWRNREDDLDDYDKFGYEYHVRNAMRQNSDVLIIQEARGKEAFHVLDAAYTGQIVATTQHAASVVEGYERFISLCQRELNQSDAYFAKMILKGFKIGAHFKRYGKKRVLNEITEIVGYEEGSFLSNTLVRYNPIKKTHEIVGPMSKGLWNFIEEAYAEEEQDLSSISMFRPKGDK